MTPPGSNTIRSREPALLSTNPDMMAPTALGGYK
jgi:hypothetical protein